MDNKKAFEEGIKKANAIIADRVALAFFGVGRSLLDDAMVSAEYRNLTGNTITSLAFGLYRNFGLSEVIYLEGLKPAIRVKLNKGETVYSFIDYDSNYRPYFRGDVATDGGYGEATSMRFLQSYRPSTSQGIVITTGTEYSEYLEQELGLNVLTETKDKAKSIALSLFKKNFKRIE